MKYAIINDQHFGVNGDSEYFFQNYAKFYRGVFHPYLEAHDIRKIIVPGDFWQSRKNINPLTLSVARELFFDPLEASGREVFMAYGNHDVYYKNTNRVNSIDFLDDMYECVSVVSTHRELEGGVLLTSWICPENRETILAAMKDTDCPYLVGHFEIEGHMMTPGYPCQHGMSRQEFAKFKKVISGHFHVRGNDGKIFYTSNPSQTSWADWGQEKGFHVFDTDDGSLTPVNNPHEVYAVHAWGESSVFKEVEPDLSGKIVKIRVPSLHSVDMAKFKAFVNAVTEVAHNTTIVETDKYDGTSGLTVGGAAEAMSIVNVMTDYVDEVAPEELKELCKEQMISLYSRATEVKT